MSDRRYGQIETGGARDGAMFRAIFTDHDDGSRLEVLVPEALLAEVIGAMYGREAVFVELQTRESGSPILESISRRID